MVNWLTSYGGFRHTAHWSLKPVFFPYWKESRLKVLSLVTFTLDWMKYFWNTVYGL